MLLDGEILHEGQVAGGMVEGVFDFRSAFAEIILQIAIMGHETSLSVESSISPDVPRYFHGDSEQLMELLLYMAGYCLARANGASISVHADAPPAGRRDTLRQLDITFNYGPAEYCLPLDDPLPAARRKRSSARHGEQVNDAAGNLFKARRLAKLLNGEVKAVPLAEEGYHAYRVRIALDEAGAGPALRRNAT